MRTNWQDRDRTRSVEVTPLGSGRVRVQVDGSDFEVLVEPLPDGRLRLTRDGEAVTVRVTPAGSRRFVRLGNLDFTLELAAGPARGRGRAAHGGLESPMPGVVTRLMTAVGDHVEKGQPLLAVEAMKMEHVLRAPRAGTVRELRSRPGDMVQPGIALVVLDET